MDLQRKKKEKFINAFFEGMDDPVMEAVMRIVHLGEDESKLNELLERQQMQMEDYMSHFELTDARQTMLSEEEQEQAKSQNSVNGNDNTLSTSNQGHANVSLEYSTNNGTSSER